MSQPRVLDIISLGSIIVLLVILGIAQSTRLGTPWLLSAGTLLCCLIASLTSYNLGRDAKVANTPSSTEAQDGKILVNESVCDPGRDANSVNTPLSTEVTDEEVSVNESVYDPEREEISEESQPEKLERCLRERKDVQKRLIEDRLASREAYIDYGAAQELYLAHFNGSGSMQYRKAAAEARAKYTKLGEIYERRKLRLDRLGIEIDELSRELSADSKR